MSEAQSPPTNPPKKRTGCLLWGIGIFVGLVVLGSLSSPTDTDSAPSASAAPSQDLSEIERREVSAGEIVRAFEANEIAAEREFADAPLRVTGIVLDISAGIGERSTVRIGEPGNLSFQGIQAGFDSDQADWAAELTKGVEIVLLCDGAGEILAQPILNDCVPERSSSAQ